MPRLFRVLLRTFIMCFGFVSAHGQVLDLNFENGAEWIPGVPGFGYGVGTAGDLDGDGLSEYLVHGYDFDYTYIDYSTALGSEAFNFRMVMAGDLNGDGYGDMASGSPGYTNGESNEGAVFVYYGSDTGIGIVPDDTVQSNIVNGYMGWNVSLAGDVNNDGYSDLVASSEFYSNGQTNEGAVYVIHGSASGVNPTHATVLEINVANAKFGETLAPAGDVNGDGYSDILVGTTLYSNGQTEEGAIFVYHGSASGVLSSSSFSMESNDGGAHMGFSISPAGDIDSDGYSDIIFSAPEYRAAVGGLFDQGKVWICYGSSSGITTLGMNEYLGENVSQQLGYHVSTLGDFDGDGYGDIGIGSPFYNSNTGMLWIIYGSTWGADTTIVDIQKFYGSGANTFLGGVFGPMGDRNGDGITDLIMSMDHHPTTSAIGNSVEWFYGENEIKATKGYDRYGTDGDWFGRSMASAGDLNADGMTDFVVANRNYTNGQSLEGAAYVYYGFSSTLGSPTILEGNQASSGMANDLSSAGDINGDGYADLLVGAYLYDNGQSNEGLVFVYYGSAAGVGTTPDDTLEMNQADSRFGYSVSGAGDLNADGYADVVVGAYGYDNGNTNEGAAFVYYGSPSGLSASPDFTFESDQDNASMGWSVSGAGDINGDGYDDLLVSAYQFDNGQVNEGAVFVYLGSPAGPVFHLMLEGDQASCQFGFKVIGVPDMNNDGYGEIAISAPLYDDGEVDEGVFFLYRGSASGVSLASESIRGSDQASARMGYGLSSTDLDGDGSPELLLGAYVWDQTYTDGGTVLIYTNAYSPFVTAQIYGTQASSWLGYGVAGGMDINGDGFGDFIAGAPRYDFGAGTDNGNFQLYRGGLNPYTNWRPKSRPGKLYRSDLSTPISIGGATGDFRADFGIAKFGASPFGRGDVRVAWDMEPEGSPYEEFPFITGMIVDSFSNVWMDAGLGTVEVKQKIRGISFQNKLRVRTEFHPSHQLDGRRFGPWFYLGVNDPSLMTILPLELNEWQAVRNGMAVDLFWNYPTESEGDHYRVQRSSDGMHFTMIGEVDGTGALEYSFTDAQPMQVNYYRLAKFDREGAALFSEVIRVDMDELAAEVTVRPNPARDFLYIESSLSNLRVTLCDVAGRVFRDETLEESRLFVGDLAAGVYFLNVQDGDSRKIFKVLIQP